MKKKTDIIFIIDRSGSMYGMEKDTIGGYNSVLSRQKDEDHDSYITTVLFNQDIRIIHDRVPIKDVNLLTDNDYSAEGCTALLDAVGCTIKKHIKKYKETGTSPDKTMVVIITDGMENASTLYSYKDVKKMIDWEQEMYDWEFLFLGANIDAAKEAGNIGIDESHSVNYKYDSYGTQLNYSVLSETMSDIAGGLTESVPKNWSAKIKEYEEE